MMEILAQTATILVSPLWQAPFFSSQKRAPDARHATEIRPIHEPPRFTFRSIASQISAAISGPPKSLTCRMPVGEVTLISVR